MVRGLKTNLLGLPAIIELNLAARLDATTDYDLLVENKFPTIFQGLGNLGEPYTIQLKEDATPHTIFSARNIPLPLRGKVQDELARMETQGIISKVDEPTPWCTGMVAVPNHWSIEATMEEYILRLILKLKLSSDHPALLLYDNFKGQCTEKLLKLLDANNISVVLIPPHCTDRLQPLDVSVNKAAKEFLRNSFQKWYASIVCSQLNRKTEKKAVDLRLSVMKPHGAKWLVELYEYLRNNPDVIINGFRETGILDCIDSVTSILLCSCMYTNFDCVIL